MHLITCRSSSGAGGKSVCASRCTSLLVAHQELEVSRSSVCTGKFLLRTLYLYTHSTGITSPPEPFHCYIWKKTQRLWSFAAAKVLATVFEYGRYLYPPSSRNAYNAGDQALPQVTHCTHRTTLAPQQQHLQRKLTEHRTP